MVLGAHDVGALPATQIAGGHAVAGPVAFAEVVITSTGDLDDPDLGTPRIVVDNTSLQHVVVTEGDYTYTSQCVSNAYGVEVSDTTEYLDGTSYSSYFRCSADGGTLGQMVFDDAGEPYSGNRLTWNSSEIRKEEVSPDGKRSQIIRFASDFSQLGPNKGVFVDFPLRPGTLALAEEDNAAVLRAVDPMPSYGQPAVAIAPDGDTPQITKAKANVNAHGACVVGIVVGEQFSVEPYTATVKSSGVVPLLGGLTPLLPIYLGNGGVLTQTPPDSSTCAFLLQVGVALSPTTMLVRIGEPIYFGVADLPDV